MIRVTIWNEFVQEQMEQKADEVLGPDVPDFVRQILIDASKTIREMHNGGIQYTLQSILTEPDGTGISENGDSEDKASDVAGTKELMESWTAPWNTEPIEVRHIGTLDMPECGLTEEVLADTDVLVYWAHVAHDQVPDAVADRIRDHVLKGMGLITLHSSHPSKIMQKLLGTTGTLQWRDNDFCRVWNVNPGHPIAAGIPSYIELCPEEMYGECFDIPKPDDLVFISWFRGGEVFRSGCTWQRGAGKIFYFQPGHETNPSYFNPYVRQIIRNAVRWAKPSMRIGNYFCPNVTESPESKAAK